MAKQRRKLSAAATPHVNTPEELEVAVLAARAKKPPARRRKMTFDLDEGTARELRVAVSELPPKAVGGSLSALVSRAIRAEIEVLRKRHNGGKPFESDEEPTVPKGPGRKV